MNSRPMNKLIQMNPFTSDLEVSSVSQINLSPLLSPLSPLKNQKWNGMFESSEANGACKWAHCLALPSTNWKLFQIKSDNAGETRRDKHGFGRLCLAAGRIHPDNPYLSSISSTSSIHLGPPTKRSREVTPTRGISSRHFKTIEAIKELVRAPRDEIFAELSNSCEKRRICLSVSSHFWGNYTSKLLCTRFLT